MICDNCPRKCDITKGRFCGVDGLKIAKIMIHYYEEPCISGTKGCGAIFFSGCNLRCCYCQNRPISHGLKGEFYTVDELCNEILKLQDSGAHNIELITAAHLKKHVAEVLARVRPKLHIPVIYNSSGYEGDLSVFNGLIDVYLPDFKYLNVKLGARYSAAPDYPRVAIKTISQMIEQVGEVIMENGLIKKGVIIRHLVLPGHRDDSIAIMRYIAKRFPSCLVSIMSQYTPEFLCGAPELNRKVTSFEYNSVVNAAYNFGLKGYMQDKTSATKAFTPEF